MLTEKDILSAMNIAHTYTLDELKCITVMHKFKDKPVLEALLFLSRLDTSSDFLNVLYSLYHKNLVTGLFSFKIRLWKEGDPKYYDY